MTNIYSMFIFGIGAFFIGVAFTTKIVFSLLGRHSEGTSEGCLGSFLAIVALTIAVYFFHIFLSSM